ncbi:hypothetical protein AAFP30_00170 [Gordonia sp. CPCC 205515]|uniref:hypothetical protein n=1 Tax=Gordonia sp. CPCC 205515 TaxID=3140791 RepID=UPI003AF401C3
MNTTLESFTDFNVAMAGVSGALAGLLIVAISVNIERVLSSTGISSRAASAIGSLVLAITVSCLALLPGQPLWALGIEVLAGAGVVAVMATIAVRRIYQDTTQPRALRPFKSVMCLLPPAAFAVGGIILLFGDLNGYYWVAVGSMAAIVTGITISWVALVELLR